jgi:hypothetical protein
VPRAVVTGCRGGQGSLRAVVLRAVETGCRGGQSSPGAVVPRAVGTGCKGGQGSPRAVVPRAVETGCRGGQGSPRAVVPSGRNHKTSTSTAGVAARGCGRTSRSIPHICVSMATYRPCTSDSGYLQLSIHARACNLSDVFRSCTVTAAASIRHCLALLYNGGVFLLHCGLQVGTGSTTPLPSLTAGRHSRIFTEG